MLIGLINKSLAIYGHHSPPELQFKKMAGRRNSLGRIYESGKALSGAFREEIIELYNQGFTANEISSSLKVTVRGVNKIVDHFRRYGTVLPFTQGGSDPHIMTNDLLQCIELWKLEKPSVYAKEIQQRLLLEGLCDRDKLPSISTINQSIAGRLDMSRKKITSVPTEYLSNIDKVNEYLEITSRLKSSSLHFFDEASVVKTTSNRQYGSSYRGTEAVEVQRYASNATFTVNLLHSIFGVDFYNIIPGASNGGELISFFDYALECQKDNGLPVFIEGDTVIMDNCGFHHGRATERLLREMLGDKGVNLLFQPPYSPHLNTCENCFHQMKQTMRCNEQLSQSYTEMAIIDALNNITAAQSVNYFRHCGYV